MALEMEFVILRSLKQPQWQPGGFDHVHPAIVAVNGAGKTGVGQAERALLVVPYGVNNGYKLGLNGAFIEREIHGREHLRRCGLHRAMGAQNSAYQRSVNSGGGALTADVAYSDRGTTEGITQEIVEVAANSTRWDESGSHVQVLPLGQ